VDSLLLLSGGLDSCVLLAHILSLGKKAVALSFDYGQRHKVELLHAKKIAARYNIEHHLIHIDPALFASARSSLTDTKIAVQLENTYVPARNLLFLASAISFAESRGISEIYFGANRDDIELFPDCRKEFFEALTHTAHLGTRMEKPISLLTPFSSFTKREIITLGKNLSAPIEWSFSCYDPRHDETPCGTCQACRLRNQ
jgi:7-cyano-7-deazaguanine synthase